MFFNTNKEKQDARVYGITDAFGVTLINRDHPFPLLVEEEERIHGALLANTTHGAFFRTLGSVSGFPNRSFDLRQVNSGRARLPPAHIILNTMEFIRDQTALNSLQCHEGFAKYISYAFQFQRVSAADRSALEDRLSNDRQSYRLLDSLCRILSIAAETSAHDMAQKFGYQAAKAVLNTTELEAILRIQTSKKLWERLQAGGFASDLDARAKVAIDALANLVSDHLSSKEKERVLSGKSEDIYRIFADRLRFAGFETNDLKDGTWLVAHSALLGKRIEAFSEGVYCSEMAPFLGWTYGGDKQVTIDNRFLSKTGSIQVADQFVAWRSTLRSDPALRVFYTPNTAGGNWTIANVEDFDAIQWNKLAIYVTPAFEQTGEPARRRDPGKKLKTLRVHLYCFGMTPMGPRSFVLTYMDWKQIGGKLSAFRKNTLVVIALEPWILGPTISKAPVDELAGFLGRHAPVVYWEKVASPESLAEESAFVLLSGSEEENEMSANRGPCAVINRRNNHCTLTCIPKYAVEIVKRASLSLSDEHFERGRLTRILQSIQNEDSWADGAKLAYELIYEFPIIPVDLPYYSGLELYQFLKPKN
jgi:hypothetical protein